MPSQPQNPWWQANQNVQAAAAAAARQAASVGQSASAWAQFEQPAAAAPAAAPCGPAAPAYRPPVLPQSAAAQQPIYNWQDAAREATAMAAGTVTGSLASRVLGGAIPSSSPSPCGHPATTGTPSDPLASLLRTLIDDRERDGKQPCPPWNGKDPGVSLRPWLRSQLFWQQSTSTPRHKWGVKLYWALEEGSLPRLLADGLGESVILGPDGYTSILKVLLARYAPYLESELPKAVEAFFYGGDRERGELFASYVARRELLCESCARKWAATWTSDWPESS